MLVAISFFVSIWGHLWRDARAAKHVQPGRLAVPSHQGSFRRTRSSPSGLAVVPVPATVALPHNAILGGSIVHEIPAVANAGGWGDIAGRFISAAVCAATVGRALGSAKRRSRVSRQRQRRLQQPQAFTTVSCTSVTVPVGAHDAKANYESARSSASSTFQHKNASQAISLTRPQATNVLASLSSADNSEMEETLEWIIRSAWVLSNAYEGSRIVQKAFEIARGAHLSALRETLVGHVLEASKSPHANHVLQKCIEVTPASELNFVVDEIIGNATLLAKNRFGCRVLERLIEHNCAELHTGTIMDEIVSEASKLCRHSFANFVIQHVLEHGSASQKICIVDALVPEVCRLSKHRVASHVVQSALVYASSEDRHRLKEALSADVAELEDIRKTQCGRFVIQEMDRIQELQTMV